MNGEDQEQVLFESVARYIEGRVQNALPPEQRGMRARDPIRQALRPRLRPAIDAVVLEVFREVGGTLPRVVPVLEGLRDGRHKTIRNTMPCRTCGDPSPSAVMIIEGGAQVAAECDRCAPDFVDRRQS